MVSSTGRGVGVDLLSESVAVVVGVGTGQNLKVVSALWVNGIGSSRQRLSPA